MNARGNGTTLELSYETEPPSPSQQLKLSEPPPSTSCGPAQQHQLDPSACPILQITQWPLTFNWRRLQPLADILHSTIGVIEPGNRLGTPQLHEVPELHHGATKVPFMVAFSNRVPRVVVGHVVRHLAGAATATPARGSCSVLPRGSGRGLLSAVPSLGAARVKQVPLTKPNFSG